MRIKHFAQYGCVNAKKVYDTVQNKLSDYGYGTRARVITIDVTGDHEWGLIPSCSYNTITWLLKGHFLKDLDNHYMVERCDTNVHDYTHVTFTFYCVEKEV